MKFCHPRGVRLTLDSGHVTRVGPEWTELPERFHQAALEKGCHCDQTVIGERVAAQPTTGPDAMQTLDEPKAIREAIQLMLARNEEDDFTAAGNPNANAVAKLCGFKVTRDSMLPVWHALKAEVAAEAAANSSGNASAFEQ
jgi:hypothetical protein